MENKRKVVSDFLKSELKITPILAGHSVLKKGLLLVMEDESNFKGIFSGDQGDFRNLSYLIEKIHNREGYKKIVGSNEICSPREFILKCYEYIQENQ